MLRARGRIGRGVEPGNPDLHAVRVTLYDLFDGDLNFGGRVDCLDYLAMKRNCGRSVPGYNDRDGGEEAAEQLRWIDQSTPWAHAAAGGTGPRSWGDIEIGPMIGPSIGR